MTSTSLLCLTALSVLHSGCDGSWLILNFSNFDNRIGIFQVHILVIKTFIIKGNYHFVPYADINIAIQVHPKKSNAVSTFAVAMTVVFRLVQGKIDTFRIGCLITT